jgi:hypothetical protein
MYCIVRQDRENPHASIRAARSLVPGWQHDRGDVFSSPQRSARRLVSHLLLTNDAARRHGYEGIDLDRLTPGNKTFPPRGPARAAPASPAIHLRRLWDAAAQVRNIV